MCIIQDVFLWDNPDQDQDHLDYSASKEPQNPSWTRILW